MRHQPMAIAFVIAIFGAAAIGIRPGSGSDDWGPILVGATLAAAMTGIVASIMQFLPQRLFVASAAVGGMVVAFSGVGDALRRRNPLALSRSPRPQSSSGRQPRSSLCS